MIPHTPPEGQVNKTEHNIYGSFIMKLNNYSLIYELAPAKMQTKTPHRKDLH